MSNSIIALLIAIGAAAWLYNKILRRTGNNIRSTLIVSAISAVLLFIFLTIVLGLIQKFMGH